MYREVQHNRELEDTPVPTPELENGPRKQTVSVRQSTHPRRPVLRLRHHKGAAHQPACCARPSTSRLTGTRWCRTFTRDDTSPATASFHQEHTAMIPSSTRTPSIPNVRVPCWQRPDSRTERACPFFRSGPTHVRRSSSGNMKPFGSNSPRSASGSSSTTIRIGRAFNREVHDGKLPIFRYGWVGRRSGTGEFSLPPLPLAGSEQPDPLPQPSGGSPAGRSPHSSRISRNA